MTRYISLKRLISPMILISFLFTSIIDPRYVSAQTLNTLPPVGTLFKTTSDFTPVIVRGLSVYADDPMKFDFIVDSGTQQNVTEDEIRVEADKLIKYFLAALTIPDRDQWVNLSPHENNRIVEENFGVTEMGKDLLAQDYILKQLMASLSNPEDKLGQNFWERVYAKAAEQYGSTDIPMDTFNKVWITPDYAKVYEGGSHVFVLEKHLKVMLEEDYVALQQGHQAVAETEMPETGKDVKDIIKTILLPELEREVNEGEHFAVLRQIYNSMILAAWFKVRLRESILGQAYVDHDVTNGINDIQRSSIDKIYNQYLEAYRVGVYDFIKEDYDPTSQGIIPRKYFSGGFDKGLLSVTRGVAPENLQFTSDLAQLSSGIGDTKNLFNIRIEVGSDQAMLLGNSLNALRNNIAVFALWGIFIMSTTLSTAVSFNNVSPQQMPIEMPSYFSGDQTQAETFDNFSSWTDQDYMEAIADQVTAEDVKALHGSVNARTEKSYEFDLNQVLAYWNEVEQKWDLTDAPTWVKETLALVFQRNSGLPESGFGTGSKEVKFSVDIRAAIQAAAAQQSAEDMNTVLASVPGVEMESFVKTPDGFVSLDNVPLDSLPKVLADTLPRPFHIGVTNSPIPRGQRREDGITWKNHLSDIPRLKEVGNHHRTYGALNSHLYLDAWLKEGSVRVEFPYYDDTRGNVNDKGVHELIGYMNGRSVWTYMDEYIAPLSTEQRKKVIVGMGNEYNYHPEYFGGDLNVFFRSLEQFAQEVHRRYPGVQVSTTWGEVPKIEWLKMTSSVDVHLMNIYRGNDPTSALRELQQILNDFGWKRQIGLGEFGISSIDGEQVQATADSIQMVRVIEYARQNENFVEATFMTGFDEEWKGKPGDPERSYGFYTTDRKGKRVLVVLKPMIEQAKQISRKPGETQPVVQTGATTLPSQWKVERTIIGNDTLMVTANVPQKMLTDLRDLDDRISALQKDVPTAPTKKSGERYKSKYLKLQQMILEREGLLKQIEDFIKLQKEIHDRDSTTAEKIAGLDLLRKKTAGIPDSVSKAQQREAVRGAISSSVSEYEMSVPAIARLIKANRHVIERAPDGEDILKIYVGAGLNYGPASGYTIFSIPLKTLGRLNINIGVDSKLGYATDALDMASGLKGLVAKKVWQASPWMNIAAIPSYMERFLNVRNEWKKNKEHVDFNGGVLQVGRYTPLNVFMRGTGKDAPNMIIHPVIVQDPKTGQNVRRVMDNYKIMDVPLAKLQRDVLTETLGHINIKKDGKTVWAPFGDAKASKAIWEKSEFPTYDQWGEMEFLFANKAWTNKDAHMFYYFQRGEVGKMIEVRDEKNKPHLMPAEEFLFGYELDTRTGETKEFADLHLFFKAQDAELNDKFFQHYEMDKNKLTPLLAAEGYVKANGKTWIVSNNFVAFSAQFVAKLKAEKYTDEQIENAENIVRQSREPHAANMISKDGRGYMNPGQIYMLPSEGQIQEAAKRAQIMAGWYNNRPTTGMAINPVTGEVLKVYYNDDLPPTFRDSAVYRKGFMIDPSKKALADKDLTVGLLNERTGEVEPGIVLFNKNAAALNYFLNTPTAPDDAAHIIVLKQGVADGPYVHSATKAVKNTVKLDSVVTTPLEYPQQKTRVSLQRQPVTARVTDEKGREHIINLPEGMMIVTDPRFVDTKKGEIGLMYRVPKKGVPLAQVYFPDHVVNLYTLEDVRKCVTIDMKKDTLYRQYFSGDSTKLIWADTIASQAGQAPVGLVIAGLNNDLSQGEYGIIAYGVNYKSEQKEMEDIGAWGHYRTPEGKIIYFYDQNDYPIDILKQFATTDLVDKLALSIGKLVVDPKQSMDAKVASVLDQIKMDPQAKLAITNQLAMILHRLKFSDPKQLQNLADRMTRAVEAEKTFRGNFAAQPFGQRQSGYSKLIQGAGEEGFKLKEQIFLMKFFSQLAQTDSTTVGAIIKDLHEKGGTPEAFGNIVDSYYNINNITLVKQEDIDALGKQIDTLMMALSQGDSIMFNLRPLVKAYDSYFLTNVDSTKTPLIERFKHIDSLISDLQGKFFGVTGTPPDSTEVNAGLTYLNHPDTGFIVQRQRAIVFWKNELSKAVSGNINDEAWVQVLLRAIKVEEEALVWANNTALPFLKDMRKLWDLIQARDAAKAAGNTALANSLQLQIDAFIATANIESRQKSLIQQQWQYLQTSRDLLQQAANSFLVNYTNTLMLAPSQVLTPSGGVAPADKFWKTTRPAELDSAYAWIRLIQQNPNLSDTLKFWIGRLDANLRQEGGQLTAQMIAEIATLRAFYEAINAGRPVPKAIRLLLQQILDNRILQKKIMVERFEILKHLRELGLDALLSPQVKKQRDEEIKRLKDAFDHVFVRLSGTGDPLLDLGLRDIAEAEGNQAKEKRQLDDLKKEVEAARAEFEKELMNYTAGVVEYQQSVAQIEHQIVDQLDVMYENHEITWAVHGGVLQLFQSLYDQGPSLPVVTMAGDQVYLLKDETAKILDKAVEKIRVKGFGKIDAKPETVAEMLFGYSKDMKDSTQTPVTALFRKVAARGVWKDFVEAFAGTSRVYISGQTKGLPQEKFALLSVEIPKDVLAGWSARLAAGFENVYQYETFSDSTGANRNEHVLLLVPSGGFSTEDGKLTVSVAGFLRQNLSDTRQGVKKGKEVGDPTKVDSKQWMAGASGVINWNMNDKNSAKLVISTAASSRTEQDSLPAVIDFFTNQAVPGSHPTPVTLVAGNKAAVGSFQLKHEFDGGFSVMVALNGERQEMTGPLGGVRDPQTKVFGSVGAGYHTPDGKWVVNAERAIGADRTGAVIAFNGGKVRMRVQAALQDGEVTGSTTVSVGKGLSVQVGKNIHGDFYGRVAMGHEYEDGSQWSVGITPGYSDQNPLFFSAGGRLPVFAIGSTKNLLELTAQRDTMLAKQDLLLKKLRETQQRLLKQEAGVSKKDIGRLQGQLSYARTRAKTLSERIERLRLGRERQIEKAKEKGWHIFPDANNKELYYITKPLDDKTLGLFPTYSSQKPIFWHQNFDLPDTLSRTDDILTRYQVEYGSKAIQNMLDLIRGDGDGFAISFERKAPMALTPLQFVHNKPIKFMTEVELKDAGVVKDEKGYYLVLTDAKGQAVKRYLGKNLKEGGETRLLTPKQIKQLMGLDMKYPFIVEATNRMLDLMVKGKTADGVVYDLQKGVRLLTQDDMKSWSNFDVSDGALKGVVDGYYDAEKKNPIFKWFTPDGSVVEFTYAGQQAFKKMTSEKYGLSLKEGNLFGTADDIRSVVKKYDIYWVEDPEIEDKNYLTMAASFAPSDLPRISGKRLIGLTADGKAIKDNVSNRVVIGLPQWMEDVMYAFEDERLAITSDNGRAGILEQNKMQVRKTRVAGGEKAIRQYTPKKDEDIFTGFFATRAAVDKILDDQTKENLTPEQKKQLETLKKAQEEREKRAKEKQELDKKNIKNDDAQLTVPIADPVGGIKMDAALLKLQTEGEGLEKPLVTGGSPNGPVFQGLFHRIIDIRPVTMSQVLGMVQNNNNISDHADENLLAAVSDKQG